MRGNVLGMKYGCRESCSRCGGRSGGEGVRLPVGRKAAVGGIWARDMRPALESDV